MSAPERARQALRAYLEQRREFGESELTLDSLNVDEVLQVLGARAGSTSDSSESATVDRGRDAGRPQASGSPERSAASSRAPERDAAASRAPGRDAPGSRAPESGRSAGDGGSADWREALRAAGAEPGQKLPTQHEKDQTAVPPRKSAARTSPAPPDWVKSKADSAGKRPPATAPVSLDDVPAGIEIPASAAARGDRKIASLASIELVAREVHDCTRCSLYQTATQAVPGEGNPNADFVCVGEAPGANEDATGKPFVGQAGQLLTKILAAINLSREDVFICNVLKHRPPGNRNPQPEEIEACSPYLIRQLALLEPRVIVAFGTFAAQTLLETTLPLGRLRGQVHRFHGIPLIVTYHPAALLRNSAWKRPTWEDVQLARRLLDRPGNT